MPAILAYLPAISCLASSMAHDLMLEPIIEGAPGCGRLRMAMCVPCLCSCVAACGMHGRQLDLSRSSLSRHLRPAVTHSISACLCLGSLVFLDYRAWLVIVNTAPCILRLTADEPASSRRLAHLALLVLGAYAVLGSLVGRVPLVGLLAGSLGSIGSKAAFNGLTADGKDNAPAAFHFVSSVIASPLALLSRHVRCQSTSLPHIVLITATGGLAIILDEPSQACLGRRLHRTVESARRLMVFWYCNGPHGPWYTTLLGTAALWMSGALAGDAGARDDNVAPPGQGQPPTTRAPMLGAERSPRQTAPCTL